MTDLAKSLRDEARGARRRSRRRRSSRPARRADGTRKWLFDVGDGNAVETVFIPEDDRGTLCVSSQAGCAVDCRFCSTGKQGFNRNLTPPRSSASCGSPNRTALARRRTRAGPTGRAPITNVVMMGMGEPLQNFDAVVPALRLMLDDNALRPVAPPRDAVDLGRRADDRPPRATTARWRWRCRCTRRTTRCATTSCRSTASTRCAELLAACKRYLERAPRDFVTFEYCMLDGVNDSAGARARAAATLVARRAVQVQPDPVQSVPGVRASRARRASASRAFAQILQDAGIVDHDAQDARRRHRRRLRPARGRVRDRQRVRLGDRVVGANSP